MRRTFQAFRYIVVGKKKKDTNSVLPTLSLHLCQFSNTERVSFFADDVTKLMKCPSYKPCLRRYHCTTQVQIISKQSW